MRFIINSRLGYCIKIVNGVDTEYTILNDEGRMYGAALLALGARVTYNWRKVSEHAQAINYAVYTL